MSDTRWYAVCPTQGQGQCQGQGHVGLKCAKMPISKAIFFALF